MKAEVSPARLGAGARAVILCALVGLGVNTVLSLHHWIPRESFAWALAPTLEALAVLWLIAAATLSPRGGRRRRLLLAGAALLFAVMAVFSAAETLFQYIYARPFVPAADVPMVRGGLLLLFGNIGPVVEVLTPVAVILILAAAVAFGFLLAWAGSLVLSRMRPRALGIGVAAVTLAAVPLVAALGTPQILSVGLVRSLHPAGYQLSELAPVAAQAERAETEPTGSPADTAADDPADPRAVGFTLPGIRDRDIYVFVIEAYGKAAFSRDSVYAELEPSYDALVEVLQNRGYQIKSHFIEAPVAGGFSWLAEATFLTGQNIDVEPKFEALLESGSGSLTRMLHDYGYYTMMVRPGTINGPWPEGWDFYRFEDSLVAYDGDFDYHGPWFSFVPITDQFAIWAAHQRLQEVRAEGGAAEDRPLYVHYQLVSSHTPFNRIPPYIEDWDHLGDGSVYHERANEIQRFDNTWGGGRELDEGYVASLEYVFTSITEYLDRFMNHDDDPILVFFGDHQPQRPIRESDATLSVPIHIASREPEILSPFAEYGYEPGFRPTQERPHPHFTEFYPMFAEIARRGRTVERPR